ncbi:proprotein convertase P-domain-containing protein [Candidatus Woesearchaeota archaeon]|nr:proprotein convertase P-domain-containing protein [Candidatus Woesearchaeota archaeon]
MAKKEVKSNIKKNISKTKSKQTKPKVLQTPASFTKPQKEIHYWGIFLYAALILIILLGVLMLVKYGDVVVGKVAGVAYTTESNKVTITGAAQGEIIPFTYNEKYYKLKVGTLTDGKVAVDVVVDADYIIFKPSEVKEEFITPLKEAIIANEKTVQVIEDITQLTSFTNYKSLFVSLGVYGAKHSLTLSEYQLLTDYLNKGGKLYVEGGDTFFLDPINLKYYLHIKAISEGDTQIIGALAGQHFLLGYDYDITPLYSLGNNFVDHIDKEFNTPAVVIQQGSKDGQTFGTAVAYEDATKLYRTIGSSVPFAALVEQQDGKTKKELMAKYLEFFETGLPTLQCTIAQECDDINPCTIDSCANSFCVNTPQETCTVCEWDKPCTVDGACSLDTSTCTIIPGTKFSSTDSVLNINSITPKIISKITIPTTGIIEKVYVKLNIMHTWRGDLKITLTHNGKTITLQNNNPADSNLHLYYTYDLSKIAEEGTMDDFKNIDMNGEWVLTVEDTSPTLNNGKLIGWSLYITEEVPQ